MKTLVVGAGGIARQHLGALRTLPQVEQIHVCDLSAVTARAMADRFGLDGWSTDVAESLRVLRPDVVHVTTPPLSHHQLSRLALDAGCHVIVEKPATAVPGELVELVELADRRGLVLVEDYNYLFNDTVADALARLRSGGYGELVHVDVQVALDILGPGSTYLDPATNRAFTEMKGGPIADFLPHLASLAHAFVGPHRRVLTSWSRTIEGHPFPADELRALVEGATATASLSFSARSRPDLFAVRVAGTQMRSQINLFEGRVAHERQLGTARPLVPLLNGLRESADVGFGSLRALAGKLSGGPGAYHGLWSLVRQTYAALEAGSPPPISSGQMLEVNALVSDLTGQGVPT